MGGQQVENQSRKELLLTTYSDSSLREYFPRCRLTMPHRIMTETNWTQFRIPRIYGSSDWHSFHKQPRCGREAGVHRQVHRSKHNCEGSDSHVKNEREKEGTKKQTSALCTLHFSIPSLHVLLLKKSGLQMEPVITGMECEQTRKWVM